MLDSLVRVSRRVLKVPKAIASPTGFCFSTAGSVRGHRRQQQAGSGVGTRSDVHGTPSGALATGRTRSFIAAPSLPCRTVGLAGREPRVRADALSAARPPPRPLDRRPTGRDVLLEEKCTRSTRVGDGRRDRPEGRPSHDRRSQAGETR